MPSILDTSPRPVTAVVLFLLGTTVFSVAYCQAPLYYSNQNQYFLHGLAHTGLGHLHEDWLANTRDPTPVFTALVMFTMRFLHPWTFYIYYALLLGAYAAAMLGLFWTVVGPGTAARRWPVFVALFVAVHSALARWCSYRWLGQDYPWYLQAGVAGQYILGASLQPSAFGALMVVAVCLFVRERPYLAAVCNAVAATVHPSALLPAALLTLGFLTALCQEGRYRQAVLLGAWALTLVLPVVVHVAIAFQPTTPKVFGLAQDILVNFRIPHHCRPDRWFDGVAVFQIVWVLLALALVWRTRLFAVLAVPSVLAVLLTLLQVLTGNNTLALLFPWRVSSVLVPIATTIILTRLVALPALPLDGSATRAVSALVVLLFVTAGLWISVGQLAFQSGDQKVAFLDFVRDQNQSGQVYFLPVSVPAPSRGAMSSDFKPLPEKRLDAHLIPLDLQQFRLSTGAPLFVDFKSIPYQDSEVLEWRERIRQAQTVQALIQVGSGLVLLGDQLTARALEQLRDRGVTHLIAPTNWTLPERGLKKVYEDPYYRIYELRASPPH